MECIVFVRQSHALIIIISGVPYFVNIVIIVQFNIYNINKQEEMKWKLNDDKLCIVAFEASLNQWKLAKNDFKSFVQKAC